MEKTLLKSILKKLEIDLGKKYNVKTLYKMRQFYYLFSDRNFSTVSRILSWSHYSELLSIKDKNEVEYYLNESLNNNLGGCRREWRDSCRVSRLASLHSIHIHPASSMLLVPFRVRTDSACRLW